LRLSRIKSITSGVIHEIAHHLDLNLDDHIDRIEDRGLTGPVQASGGGGTSGPAA
jgi:hypothetical protein